MLTKKDEEKIVKTLIVGLGNPILGDDGVGWRVAEQLNRQELPPGVEVDTLAYGGLSLMERLVGYQRAIIVDALATGKFPIGSVHVFPLETLDNPFLGHMGSAHEASLQTALEMGRALGEDLPEKVTVVAVESPYVYDLSDELSPQAAEAVPEAVRAVMELLEPEDDDK